MMTSLVEVLLGTGQVKLEELYWCHDPDCSESCANKLHFCDLKRHTGERCLTLFSLSLLVNFPPILELPVQNLLEAGRVELKVLHWGLDPDKSAV